MRIYTLLVVTALSVVGCSSSNNDEPVLDDPVSVSDEEVTPDEAIPPITPQNDGTSVVGTLGLDKVLELAELWLDGGNLSLLDAIDENEAQLANQPNEAIIFDGDLEIYQCSESGSATFRFGDRNTEFYSLEKCVNAGMEISGNYNNYEFGGRLQFGSESTNGRRYDQLRITGLSDSSASLDITGNISDTFGTSTNVECFGSTFISTRNASAERVIGVANGVSTEIEDYSMYTSNRSGRRRGATLESEDCISSSIDSERTRVTVSSGALGDVSATIKKDLEIQRQLLDGEEDTAAGSLVIEFSDESSVTVTLLSSRDNSAKIDVVADGSVRSMLTNYSF